MIPFAIWRNRGLTPISLAQKIMSGISFYRLILLAFFKLNLARAVEEAYLALRKIPKIGLMMNNTKTKYMIVGGEKFEVVEQLV